MQAIREAITGVTGRGDTHNTATTLDQSRASDPMLRKPIEVPRAPYAEAPAGVYEEESGITSAQIKGQLPESLGSGVPAGPVGGAPFSEQYGTAGAPIGGAQQYESAAGAPIGGVQQYQPAAGGAPVGDVQQYETVGPDVRGYEGGLGEDMTEGQEQLLREREWDRRDSKQGRRDLPSGLMDKHPSLGDNLATSPSPATSGPVGDLSTTTPGSQDFTFPRTGHDAAAFPAAQGPGLTGTAGPAMGEGLSGPAAGFSPQTLANLVPGNPLVTRGLGNECDICQDESGSVLAREREQLLAHAEQLKAEQAAHAAAAAEAVRMRDEATRRAREIAEHLQRGLPARRQQLLQQQEAAEGELRGLESARASVLDRVKALEGQLSRLVEEERQLVEQRLEAERLRREIEATREGITARAAELEDMLGSLHNRHARADEEIEAAAAGLRASEEAVAAAAARLAELEEQREEARVMLQQAEREKEEVLGQLSSIEGLRSQQANRLDSIDTKHLLPLDRERDSISAKERDIRQQTEALMGTVESVRVEAEQRTGAQQQLMQKMTSARAELEGMEAQAANLSCQESALMARAAGAEGLEHGEQARAAAAAAEAAGLKAAAVTLSEAKLTTPTRLASDTTFSGPAATSTTAPLQRKDTSSSSSSSSGRMMAGGGRAAELDRDFPGAAGVGPTAVIGPAAAGSVERDNLDIREIDSSSRDFDRSSREFGGEGLAPLPRPAAAGPIGGALLPTDAGGSSFSSDVHRNNLPPNTTTAPVTETHVGKEGKGKGLGKKIKNALGLGKARRRRGRDTSPSRRRDSSPSSSSSSSSPSSTPRAGMTGSASYPTGATTTEALSPTAAAADRRVTFDNQPEVISTGEQHVYAAGEPVVTDIRERTTDAFADSAAGTPMTAAGTEGEGLAHVIQGAEGTTVAGLTTGPGITDGDLAAGATSGPSTGVGSFQGMGGITGVEPIGLDGVTPYRATGDITAGPSAELTPVSGTFGGVRRSDRVGGTMSDMPAGQTAVPGDAVYSEDRPVVGSRYNEDVRPTADQTTGTTGAGDTSVLGAIKRMVMPGAH